MQCQEGPRDGKFFDLARGVSFHEEVDQLDFQQRELRQAANGRQQVAVIRDEDIVLASKSDAFGRSVVVRAHLQLQCVFVGFSSTQRTTPRNLSASTTEYERTSLVSQPNRPSATKFRFIEKVSPKRTHIMVCEVHFKNPGLVKVPPRGNQETRFSDPRLSSQNRVPTALGEAARESSNSIRYERQTGSFAANPCGEKPA